MSYKEHVTVSGKGGLTMKFTSLMVSLKVNGRLPRVFLSFLSEVGIDM